MASNSIRSTGSPVVLPKAGEARSTAKADYTVKAGDTLGKIAQAMVAQSGAPATKANLAKALAALKSANPQLCTPARDGGNKVFVGDPVKLPTFDAKGGWASPGAASGRQKPTAAASAEAAKQMATLKLDRELGEMAKQYAPFMTPTSASQKSEINALLERVKTEAPALLDTPAAHLLKARALPDRVSAEPPSLPNQPARPAPRAAPKPVLAPRAGPLE